MTSKNNFVKHNVSYKEYILQKTVYDMNIVSVPQIISYDAERKIMVMEKVNGMSVADMYGESYENVPESIKEYLIICITKLLDSGISFNDLTGYNIIEEYGTGKIWFIDYGDADYVRNCTEEELDYQHDFIAGKVGWNEKYA